jgi:tRNA A-37 threonylcarbamoyl transferase component Bud32
VDSPEFMLTPAIDSLSRTASKHSDLTAELQIITGPPEQPDELGRLEHYRILRILGGGGMGIVVEAEDCQLKRKVALKVMRASLASASDRRRFLREAQAAAAIQSDHIVPIFHVGDDRGVPYLAMPLLKGQSLNDLLVPGHLPLAQIARIGRQIAQGLAAAHERGLIHRDIKPTNIWLESIQSPPRGAKEMATDIAAGSAAASTDYRVKILDFGLARAIDDGSRLTQPGALVGTIGYLAPEQATGGEVDARSDLFSLGCTLYRMCTGRLPFPGPDMLASLASLALDQPPAPHQINSEVTIGLSRLIMQLLEKKPGDRPASAAEVAGYLSRIEQELAAGAQSAPGPWPKPARRQPGGQVWASDANQIGIEDLDWVVFKNDIIQDFLEKRGKYFLSANKGLGKTLLLTYKRKQLTDTYHEPRHGKGQAQVFFVPEGRPFLDFMGNLHTLSASHVTFLSELVNTKRVWSLALRFSALSHHPALLSDDDREELEAFPKRLQVWLRGARVEPTVVFKEMLGYSLKEINRLIDRQENFLEQKFRQIHSGTFFFIDKVDQAIRNLPRAAWILIQAGLIEAAWDAMNANGHVKVFASIRQEAFSNYESDIKTNLYGATTVLQYSDQELQHLLDQLTKCYEGGKTFKELIQLDVVRHNWRVRTEDSFQYLRRHTLGRPRDLVIVASELSRRQQELSEGLYRTLVQETTGTVLGPNVFEEMRVFLNCLDDKQERLRFFSLLPHNILTHAEVVKFYYQFNYLDPECAAFDHYSDKLHHPFWELYSAGLLGVVATDPGSHQKVQKFKQPSDLFHDSQVALPTVDFYVIHPALDWFIRTNRPKDDYHLFQHIVVGHNCPWPNHYGALVDAERALFDLDDPGLRDTVHQVLKKVSVLLEAGQRPAQAMASLEEWQELKLRLPKQHDLLFLVLEELVAQSAQS